MTLCTIFLLKVYDPYNQALFSNDRLRPVLFNKMTEQKYFYDPGPEISGFEKGGIRSKIVDLLNKIA